MSTWTQIDAIKLCVLVENICPQYGCHVALTGGLLYKHGMRKDCDLVFYRIRQSAEIDLGGLWDAFKPIGLEKAKGFGFCVKATYEGKGVDCLFPEDKDDGDCSSSEKVEAAEKTKVELPPGMTEEAYHQFNEWLDEKKVEWLYKKKVEELAKLREP